MSRKSYPQDRIKRIWYNNVKGREQTKTTMRTEIRSNENMDWGRHRIDRYDVLEVVAFGMVWFWLGVAVLMNLGLW